MNASPSLQSGLLSGLTAVVTGASSGIGRAIALEFARSGANLVLHARANAAALARVAEEVRGAGADAAELLYDLAGPTACSDLVEHAFAGRTVDIWVHNAGADVLTGAQVELDFNEKLELLWRVDVCGTINVCREVGRRMKQHASGVILTVGWDQAATGMEGDSGEMFATVKGAVMAFSRSLAKSLAPEVRVNCLAPGWIQTKWGESAPDHWRKRAEEESLLGRWGTPQDVAAAAAFLASPQASFLTGQVLNINGGFAGSARRLTE
ncbi:MAG: SDR family oxidoreductase [Planctomycetales bacterium]|nr:SDR family oxidoreductase [Planctomycetales bacterium]